jgi:superfamily II DNA/RNA helicase
MERGVDVLVATPGRLNDHLAEGNVLLAGTEVLVLDEADQMLDLGFLPQIRRIVSRLTSKRQSLFFSATMPREIARLFVIGLAESILPSRQSREAGDDSPEMEEERRNCFVAITRTKQLLILTSAERYRGGQRQVSRFLGEMGL